MNYEPKFNHEVVTVTGMNFDDVMKETNKFINYIDRTYFVSTQFIETPRYFQMIITINKK